MRMSGGNLFLETLPRSVSCEERGMGVMCKESKALQDRDGRACELCFGYVSVRQRQRKKISGSGR
jgi:hypothetical protein